MVLSDGMVYFLKIKKIVNKSSYLVALTRENYAELKND